MLKKLIVSESIFDKLQYRQGDFKFSSEIQEISNEIKEFLLEVSKSPELFEKLRKNGCVHIGKEFIAIRFNFDNCILLDSFDGEFLLGFSTSLGAKTHQGRKGFFYHNPTTESCHINLVINHQFSNEELISELAAIFDMRRKTFAHEFAHYLDHNKSSGKFAQGYDDNIKNPEYSKQQAEVNAIFKQVTSEFYSDFKSEYESHLKSWNENSNSIIQDMIDIDDVEEGLSEQQYFDLYLTELWVHSSVCNIDYHLNLILDDIIVKTGELSPSQKKHLTGRIYVFLNNINDQFGINCKLKMKY
jgi:hypothetical protein